MSWNHDACQALRPEQRRAIVEHQVEFVPDERLDRLAKQQGPASVPARVQKHLQLARARDRQYFAFRVGNYWLTGPMPNAEMEAALIELAEAEEGES
jgi:hypothetical protein